MALRSILSLAVLLLSFAVAQTCRHDKCLHHLTKDTSAASAFCTPLLASVQTIATGDPSIVSKCKNNLPQLSSACSCFLKPTPISSTSKTTSIPGLSTSKPSSPTTSNQSSSTTPASSLAQSTTSSSISTYLTPTSISSLSSSSLSTCSNTVTITQTSCTSATRTITSISTSTTTIFSTVTVRPTATTCLTAQIAGGKFDTTTGALADFTVTQTPPNSFFFEILAPSQQQFLPVSQNVPSFLYINYVLLPIPQTFALSQPVTVCANTTSITLSAFINAAVSGGTVTFCISPTTCAAAQTIPQGNGQFLGMESTFTVPTVGSGGIVIEASVSIAADGINTGPQYVVGVSEFNVAVS